MLKAIALIGVFTAVWSLPLSAVAQTGYGVKPGAPSTSTFDRSWNRANESKDRARARASSMRERRMGAHRRPHHAPGHPVQ